MTSGMSLEDLKHQTALRLAHEQRDGQEGNDANEAATSSTRGIIPVEQMRVHPHVVHASPRARGPRPQSQFASPQGQSNMNYYPRTQNPPMPLQHESASSSYPHGRDYPQASSRLNHDSHYYDAPARGADVGPSKGAGGYGEMPLFPSSLAQATAQSPSAIHSEQMQSPTHSTQRMPRHAAALQDRGSAENKQHRDDDHVGSDLTGMDAGWRSTVRGHVKPTPLSPQALQGKPSRVNAQTKLQQSKPAKAKPKEMKSPLPGRATPPNDRIGAPVNYEGQCLFATPNTRREVASRTPTSVYSEPPRNKMHGNQYPHSSTASPAYMPSRVRTPEHFGKNNGGKQGKLPHGLTVQELKEMTRARLAAEAAEGSDDADKDCNEYFNAEISSNQSVDTGCSSKRSDHAQNHQHFSQYPRNSAESVSSCRSGISNGIAQSNEIHGYPNQVTSSHSFSPTPDIHQRQHPQTINTQYPQPRPRQHSPAIGNAPNQYNMNHPGQQPRDAWETASVASTLASEYQGSESAFPMNSCGTIPPFASPMSDAGSAAFNRGRSFSAGVNAPSSLDRYAYEEFQQAAYYDAPPGGVANRRRCATMSPPGMSRLHEDRPFSFLGNDKERLSIPPLSEPRSRHHQSGWIRQNDPLNASPQPQPSQGFGSAFEPVVNSRSGPLPQSPPRLTAERVKFGHYDRALSSGSNFSVSGDLPSSVAESVLESFTAGGRGGGIGGDVIGGSSAFRTTDDSSGLVNALGHGLSLNDVCRPSSGSLFSNEPSSIFSPAHSAERLLGTNSWGGVDCDHDEPNAAKYELGQDLGSWFETACTGDVGGTAGFGMRGRAATAPCFGKSETLSPLLVSRIDPELKDHRERNMSPLHYPLNDNHTPLPSLHLGGRANLPPGLGIQGRHSFNGSMSTSLQVLPASESSSMASETFTSQSVSSSQHPRGGRGSA